MIDTRLMLDFLAAIQRRNELPVRERLRQDAIAQAEMRRRVDEILSQRRTDETSNGTQDQEAV